MRPLILRIVKALREFVGLDEKKKEPEKKERREVMVAVIKIRVDNNGKKKDDKVD